MARHFSRSCVSWFNAFYRIRVHPCSPAIEIPSSLQGLELFWGSEPRASLADSLCPGLSSAGLSAFESAFLCVLGVLGGSNQSAFQTDHDAPVVVLVDNFFLNVAGTNIKSTL
jgi:hypothetical protein